MANKLSESDLPDLLSWLQTHLPQSFKLYHELRSHLRGKFPDLHFYVDRWPEPQAAAAVTDPAGKQLKGQEFYKGVVLGVFGETEDAVATFLKDERVVNWEESTVFCAVSPLLCSLVTATAKDRGSTPRTCSYRLLKATQQDVHKIPVPDGMNVMTISEESVGIVSSTWKFNYPNINGFVQDQIKYFPSVVLKSHSGEHIGHMLGRTCGTLGMLHVLPPFRRKGYAKVIISQLAHEYFDMGEDAYVSIDEDHQASISLHESMGFKKVPGMQMTWIYCTPLSQ